MSRLFNLSLRYKLPLWGSGLIVMSAVAVSTALIVQAYDDLRSDLLTSSASLSQTLAKTLFPVILNNEVMRAYDIIQAPLHGESADDLIQPELILALDKQQKVFVTTQPDAFPLLTDVRIFNSEYAKLAERITSTKGLSTDIVTFSGDHRIYVAAPISEDGELVGTVVVVHSEDKFLPRFRNKALRAGLTTLLVLALLLPINWYWGQRMAIPIVQLARSIVKVARGDSIGPQAHKYSYRDELGQLIDAYAEMVQSLKDKDRLEQAMIRSERLAAIGRLSASIAHEINNPLGGMVVALDNFKRRGGHNEHTLKTMAMLERGLAQIRETVSAILIEVKVNSRNFGPRDVEDFDTLLAGESSRRAVTMRIESDLAGPVSLPATLVRQILMNLLLNALHASESSGTVHCNIHHDGVGKLIIDIVNSGESIPKEVMDHLFEPFANSQENGTGLGLWVTYQIVSQLRGQIAVESHAGLTRFIVTLPTGEPS